MDTHPPLDEPAARARIEDLLAQLRSALVDYRAAADFRPPLFILEKPAPAIPPEALQDCRVYPDRESLLATLPVGGRVAEVGTQHGNWANYILWQKMPEELHLFDLDFGLLRADVRDEPRVRLHAGDSSSALGSMPDGCFDWIYIDADHSYAGVCRDAEVAARKLAPGGVLVFNDYLLWSALEAIPYGVVTCVNEMLCTGGWDAIGLALTPHGYFDIALRSRAVAP